MIDDAIIDAMLAAGATAEVIAAAVKASNAREAARREAKRANNAERQRRFRERHNADNALHDVSNGYSSDKEKSPTPSKEITSPEVIISPPVRTRARGWPCPEGVDPQHWADFLANRRSKRLTQSDTALRGQMRALAELSDDEWPPGELVRFAAERGWASINDPRTSPYGARNGQRPANDHSQQQPANPFLRAGC